jgi:glutamate synthase domain-containing protein 1
MPAGKSIIRRQAFYFAPTMDDEKKAFYEYHSCLIEPWDRPAD